MSKHKHHDLIVAWAAGAEIEYYTTDGVWRSASSPTWSVDNQYRIAAPTAIEAWINIYDNNDWVVHRTKYDAWRHAVRDVKRAAVHMREVLPE